MTRWPLTRSWNSGSAARWLPAVALMLLALPDFVGAGGREVTEKTGVFTVREGQRLRLVTDLGHITIHTESAAQVSYRVRIEGPSQEQINQFVLNAGTTPEGVNLYGQLPRRGSRSHLRINFEVTVPRRFDLDVRTQGGHITTDDIEGAISLNTSGGNITTGNVDGTARLNTSGGPISVHDVSGELTAVTAGGHITAGRIGGTAKLETSGGHITLRDVGGALNANTAGGHINAGQVKRDAVLRTGGGHIRVASVGGQADIETGGGNISLSSAGSRVTASTGGGNIELGDVSGAIMARTAGGSIGVVRVGGPVELETGAGSIYLTKVQGAVRASTGAGSITAWFAPKGKLSGACHLESGQGDIVVYLPRDFAATIEASIEMAGGHRVDVDPAFPLKVRSLGTEHGMRAVRVEGALNGGGEVLRLKTSGGNIELKLSEAAQQLQETMSKRQLELLEKRMEIQKEQVERDQERLEQRLEELENNHDHD